jgi:hypothetical protein
LWGFPASAKTSDEATQALHVNCWMTLSCRAARDPAILKAMTTTDPSEASESCQWSKLWMLTAFYFSPFFEFNLFIEGCHAY